MFLWETGTFPFGLNSYFAGTGKKYHGDKEFFGVKSSEFFIRRNNAKGKQICII